MVIDFPKRMLRLRQEKGISQRTAAASLLISQALLSHYENGAREPGLSFLIRAASFYGVSTDYLLGRTAHRDLLSEEGQIHYDDGNLEQNRLARERRHMLIDSATLVLELLRRAGDHGIIDAATCYLALCLHKLIGYLPIAHNSEYLKADFPEKYDLQIKKAELFLRHYTATLNQSDMPKLSLSLENETPALMPSLEALMRLCHDQMESQELPPRHKFTNSDV